MEHFEELLPIVSTPTVREACQRYGLMFKSLPRGLFVTLEDRGRVFRWEGGTCGACACVWGLNRQEVCHSVQDSGRQCLVLLCVAEVLLCCAALFPGQDPEELA